MYCTCNIYLYQYSMQPINVPIHLGLFSAPTDSMEQCMLTRGISNLVSCSHHKDTPSLRCWSAERYMQILSQRQGNAKQQHMKTAPFLSRQKMSCLRTQTHNILHTFVVGQGVSPLIRRATLNSVLMSGPGVHHTKDTQLHTEQLQAIETRPCKATTPEDSSFFFLEKK